MDEMKRITRSKLFIVLLTIVVLAGAFQVAPMYASEKNVEYLALGDSVGTGYGLATPEVSSYVSLVGNAIQANTTSNLAVNGLDSTQLLSALTAATDSTPYYEEIQNAKVITLTIGSNDLLKPFMGIISKTFNCDLANLSGYISTMLNGDFSSKLELAGKLQNLEKELQNNTTLNSSIATFTTNFPLIINRIKAINPGAEIYVMNAYNPYKNIAFSYEGVVLADLGSITDTYIKSLNKVYSGNVNGYTLIDTYSIFENGYGKGLNHALVNANISTFQFDPHPNVNGHLAIAKAVLDAMGASSKYVQFSSRDTIKAEIEKTLVAPDRKVIYAGGAVDSTADIVLNLPEGIKKLVADGSYSQSVFYQSSDPKVASVSDTGKVVALKKGIVTITTTVIVNGVIKNFQSTITVKKPYIKLVKTKATIKLREKYTFEAVGYGVNSDEITWLSSKSDILYVDRETGEATATSAGACYVVAKAGDIAVKCKVIVVKK
ncbi:MAG TPA: Ig-like domain-containing protein [Lachnospiraceae bacterium]|nr:Ig-like domain-containing protein [Lachnospiraceae bacterium]